MSNNEALTRYVGAFVDELAKSGVHQVVVSPGSRSTPIAILLTEHPDIEVMIHIDERSAAFFGLGLAKASNKPVAIVCTSGTAAANYLPAIIEAYYSRVPLLVITADRPAELRDIGAPQTMDQVDLYGKHVKWFVDLPPAESTEEMYHYVRTVCSRAVETTRESPFGPVHINFPLKEPLVPNLADPLKFTSSNIDRSIVRINSEGSTLSEEEFEKIAASLPEKGLFICGPMDKFNREFNHSIVQLAKKLNYPILADPLSQLRSGDHSFDTIIDTYDTILRNENLRKQYKPEVIIRFGAMPVSKVLSFYLKEHQNIPQYIIDNGRGWRDPVGTAYEMIYCEETHFCKKVMEYVVEDRHDEAGWLEQWVNVNEFVKKHTQMIDKDGLNEGKVVYHLPELVPNDSLIVIGNSMPIRDVDSFFHNNQSSIKLMGNRGVNGIDGVVSTAMGASVVEKDTYLLIGDLSFYHDLNGLLAAKLHNLKLTILLINNNGGGIFHMLPQAKEKQHFEQLFGTPTDLQFEYAVKMYSGTYKRVESWKQYTEAMAESKLNSGLTVIEIFTNREENTEIRRKLWDYVSREIDSYLSDYERR